MERVLRSVLQRDGFQRQKNALLCTPLVEILSGNLRGLVEPRLSSGPRRHQGVEGRILVIGSLLELPEKNPVCFG